MAAPNFAYLLGTTPATGGRAAIIQAVKSAFLGVSTTIAAAISSTGSQAVTPGAMTNIGVGTAVWINWGLSDQECVSVTAVTGSTFTATFAQTHAINATVTCGLPTLGVTNPWTSVSQTLTSVALCAVSTATTALGDADYIPIMVGNAAAALSFGMATADDFDATAGTGTPRQVVNWVNGTGINGVLTVQDASFSWWLVICEFGIALIVNIAGTYGCCLAGSLRSAQPQNMRGVGIATGAIANAAGSVVVTPDISSRLSAGQNILIINQSHNSGSTNWTAAPALMTISSVTSGGSNCTINFTGTTPHAFDAGALVGSVPQKVIVANGTHIDSASFYLSRNNDGTYASNQGQTAAVDTTSLQSNAETDGAPALDPNSLYFGEADIALWQGSTFKGLVGWLYGVQYFPNTGVANQDAFGDPSGAAVWKAFVGNSHCTAFGPLLNPRNTQASMIPIASTPFIP